MFEKIRHKNLEMTYLKKNLANFVLLVTMLGHSLFGVLVFFHKECKKVLKDLIFLFLGGKNETFFG